MTIGEGIFWSTIVAVLFASILLLTKHKKWKAFRKVAGGIVALALVSGASIWAYLRYEDRPQEAFELNGVQLGMSEVEITLAKGAPDDVSELEPIPDGFRKILLYNGYESFTYVILRGPEQSMIAVDICDKGGFGRVQGFGEFSSEESILKKLGRPDFTSVNEQGTAKLLTYSQWNAAYELEKGSVVRVCVTSQPQMKYATEYGASVVETEEEQ